MIERANPAGRTCHDDELEGRGHPQHHPEGDEHRRRGEVRPDHRLQVNINLRPSTAIRSQLPLKRLARGMKFFLSDLSIDILVMYSENIFYLGILAVEVKESVHDCEDLDSEGGAHEVQGDRGQTVTLQEGCTMRIK